MTKSRFPLFIFVASTTLLLLALGMKAYSLVRPCYMGVYGDFRGTLAGISAAGPAIVWTSEHKPRPYAEFHIDKPGFIYAAYTFETASFSAMSLSHWLLISLAALPTCLTLPCAVRYWRQWRNPTLHLCPRCQYDVRATPDQCPECGQVISPPQTDVLPSSRITQHVSRATLHPTATSSNSSSLPARAAGSNSLPHR